MMVRNLAVSKCGYHQRAPLKFSGSEPLDTFRVRASQSHSCLDNTTNKLVMSRVIIIVH